MMNWQKLLYLILGFVFLVLAYIGIAMPGIPAIPFILLAGWFFVNSSESLYNWMLRQRFLGKALKKFGEKGNSTKVKWFVISQFWVSLIVAQFVFDLSYPMIIAINTVGIIGSIVIFKLIK
jgi:uncharacterized membrane protein YbaN (DUF454 family)